MCALGREKKEKEIQLGIAPRSFKFQSTALTIELHVPYRSSWHWSTLNLDDDTQLDLPVL